MSAKRSTQEIEESDRDQVGRPDEGEGEVMRDVMVGVSNVRERIRRYQV